MPDGARVQTDLLALTLACAVLFSAACDRRPGYAGVVSHREAAGRLDWQETDPGDLLDPAQPEPEILAFDTDGFPSYPIPDGPAEPLSPGLFRSGSFAVPLPQSPVWNPPGQKRVGIQAGHWQTHDVPFELRRLSPGTSGGGWAEWEVNLLIARRAAAFLEEAGVEVDILSTTIPVRYRAHAFVSVHADGDLAGAYRGYKAARPGFSSIPEADNEFVSIMYQEYGAATGLPRDSDAHISRRMVFYYAFNTRRYQNAIDLGTPALIIETGFLTHPTDRAFLTGRPELAGRGIANGVLRFLELERGSGPTRVGGEGQ